MNRQLDKRGQLRYVRIPQEAEARAAAGVGQCPSLMGNDRHSGAIALAKQAATNTGVDKLITFAQGEVRDYVPPVRPAMVVTNPPYGELLDDEGDLDACWNDLGQFLRQQCPGATAFVLSGNPELTRNLGLRADRKQPVHNGPIDCRWLRYRVDG